MSSFTRGTGIEVLFPDNWYEENPSCAHGPMLLFERYIKGRKDGKRFFACSACRDRKECHTFVHERDYLERQKFDHHTEIMTSKVKSEVPKELTLEEILEYSDFERSFCTTCQKVVIIKRDEKEHYCSKHVLKRGISVDDLTRPSRFLLSPLENDKKNAQYFMTDDSTCFILNALNQLAFTKVVCIGMPTLHEEIQALRKANDKSSLDSILLDIDIRFAQCNRVGKFCHFNMFNHHFFDGSLTYFETFLRDGNSDVALVLDPPFGGLVDAIAESIKWLSQLYFESNQDKNPVTGSALPFLWIFPYFMEKRICATSENVKMLDYQVNYENHKKFKRKQTSRRISPVRIFTNIDLNKIVLPASEGYKFCTRCDRYVAQNNHHCIECDACTSKDGRTYVHCMECKTCTKPGRVHCNSCQRCELPNHECKKPESKTGCHICGKLTHKRKDCEINRRSDSDETSETSRANLKTKRPQHNIFHNFSSHTKIKKYAF